VDTKFPLDVLGRIEANFTKLSDQVAGPLVNVVLPDQLAHAVHAHLAFDRIHLQGGPNGIRSLINVVGIDEQGVAQLARRSCELAEDERAPFIAPGRNIFLGDEIHAVVQRRDQAEIRGAIEGLDFLMAVLALEENDGLPVAVLEAPIDTIGLGFDLREQIVIALDVSAAWRPDLHKSEFSLIAGIFLEEALDGEKALENSLGVVDAVDADAHERRLYANAAQESRAFEVVESVIIIVVVFDGIVVRESNADRKRADESAMILPQCREVLPIHARFDNAVDRLEKVIAVRLDVKANQVGAEQTVD